LVATRLAVLVNQWYRERMSQQSDNPKRELIETVAIIPARGGKQSIPYKNLQKLGGRTLLAWAVEVALAAESVDAVLVSTEDKKIAQEAERLGAIVVPRPKKYSQPQSSDAGWYSHAVDWMETEKGWKPELLVNLRPTSPLRFVYDVEAMVKYMKNNPQADGLKSVVSAPIHPYKMWVFAGENSVNNDESGLSGSQDEDSGRELAVGGAGTLKGVFDNDFRRLHGPDHPRQKIQKSWPVYWQDGQVDITRRRFVLRPECLQYNNVWGENLHGYVLDPRTSTDLDTLEDFHRAEKIYKELQKERGN